MAEINSKSAPGARGDEPREPGAFCVRENVFVEQIGECCVDSGQMMLVDPCYVLPTSKRGFPSYGEVCEANTGSGAQLTNDREAPIACVTHTGIGDGVYPVFVERDARGTVRSMTIVFIPDEAEAAE